MNSPLLRYGLYAGAVYFFCMAAAHFFGIKQPVLFIYFDTPYYAYQDKIISFAVIAYLTLFFLAARDRSVVPAALFVLGVTLLGLVSVNLSDALAGVLPAGRSTRAYWLQTGLIGGYFIFLLLLYLRDGRIPPPRR